MLVLMVAGIPVGDSTNDGILPYLIGGRRDWRFLCDTKSSYSYAAHCPRYQLVNALAFIPTLLLESAGLLTDFAKAGC
jgi:hypothetical protein